MQTTGRSLTNTVVQSHSTIYSFDDRTVSPDVVQSKSAKENSHPAVNMSRWVLGPGLGSAGRAWAGRCCENEERAAYDDQ